MTPTKSFTLSPRILLISAFLLGGGEFILAGVTLLGIQRDPKNVVALGLSAERLLLVGGSLLLAVVCLALALLVFFRPAWLDAVLNQIITQTRLKRFSSYGLTLLSLAGWLSFTCPPYLFNEGESIFVRLQPVLLATGAMSFQLLLWGGMVFVPGKLARLHEWTTTNRAVLRLAGCIFGALLALWGIIALTGIGLTQDDRFWNVAGMPLTGLQFFAALLLLAGWLIWRPDGRPSKKLDWLVFAALFITAGLLWNATPLKQHHFSPQPVEPDYQPYPASDALVYDASAHFFINGYGIFSSGYTDKPLYVVFLGFLHLLAREDYHLLTVLQVWVLALIVPSIFWLGRSLHSPPLGFFIAVLILLRQRNTIAGSHLIASANAKLLVAEVPMLLGLILCAWVIFRWLKSSPRSGIWAAVVGGVIGLASLIRLNAILLLPAVLLLALFAYRGTLKLWWKHAARLSLAFALVFVPVVLTGTGPDGVPLLVFKFMEVIRTRYLPGNTFFLPAQAAASAANLAVQLPAGQEIPPTQFVPAHFVHNLVGSLLALPNSLVYDDLPTLAQRPYWVEGNDWTGQLPPEQLVWISANLGLIALGLARSWREHRYAGMAPLLVLLVYDLALGLGRTSGSRYLVPIDWVVYFYFAVGLAELAGLLAQLLRTRPIPALKQPAAAPLASRRPAWLVFIPFVLIGGILHLLDDFLPERFQDVTSADPSALLQTIIPAEELETSHLTTYAGQVLYPRVMLENPDLPYLDFTILSPEHGVINVHLTRVNGIESFPNGDYAVVTGCPVLQESRLTLDAQLVLILEADSAVPIYPQPKKERYGCW